MLVACELKHVQGGGRTKNNLGGILVNQNSMIWSLAKER